ncbi:DUF2158 domain-containing protein [Vibrio parahaemolyticus]|uniref:YodC family protein n=1 Tax=Vibrio harveyi group TaxID=717610 RepID=UPI00111CCDEA|nr:MULTISPECIES: DUF2158 domain-containing protein [Vibrio harveyi group]EGR0195780.1 DUF2158 domain-containing protein [Vibrio alginolyticus]EII2984700.1 DUF2158 domain-containing protein [Vibrio parahaemolyticus]EJM7154293.1 DUF2158 domain-containing protein [Vibrio parahaemolyticus]ELC9518860.1 DUF2158 domain-containing protein [Vibrio alginolyticus]MCS0317145.1 DUF2158 domain-containing protein [Vibrio diabolicus]
MFKIGDVVCLKSGSPLMTVGYVKNDGNLICQWFLDGDVKSGTFNPLTLARYEDE